MIGLGSDKKYICDKTIIDHLLLLEVHYFHGHLVNPSKTTSLALRKSREDKDFIHNLDELSTIFLLLLVVHHHQILKSLEGKVH